MEGKKQNIFHNFFSTKLILDFFTQIQKRYASMCEEKVIALEACLQNEEFANFWDFAAELQNLRKEYDSKVPKKDAAAE